MWSFPSSTLLLLTFSLVYSPFPQSPGPYMKPSGYLEEGYCLLSHNFSSDPWTSWPLDLLPLGFRFSTYLFLPFSLSWDLSSSLCLGPHGTVQFTIQSLQSSCTVCQNSISGSTFMNWQKFRKMDRWSAQQKACNIFSPNQPLGYTTALTCVQVKTISSCNWM